MGARWRRHGEGSSGPMSAVEKKMMRGAPVVIASNWLRGSALEVVEHAVMPLFGGGLHYGSRNGEGLFGGVMDKSKELALRSLTCSYCWIKEGGDGRRRW